LLKAEKEMQQKQHANDTAKNAKDKSDKEVNTLQKLHHKAKTSKKTTKKANTGASADGLEVLYNKLKEGLLCIFLFAASSISCTDLSSCCACSSSFVVCDTLSLVICAACVIHSNKHSKTQQICLMS
jgi:hypothetical protein